MGCRLPSSPVDRGYRSSGRPLPEDRAPLRQKRAQGCQRFAGRSSPSAREKRRHPRRLSRVYPTLAKALLAGRRVDLAAGLLWLRDRRETGAITSGAFDLRRHDFWLRILHGNHFPDTMPTHCMSLCRTDCWLRLSHFNVTPDQFVSVTVPWSLLSSRQQTRAPTLKVLDWEPVIRFAVSLRFYWGCIILAA
jgi:hypothetical protein